MVGCTETPAVLKHKIFPIIRYFVSGVFQFTPNSGISDRMDYKMNLKQYIRPTLLEKLMALRVRRLLLLMSSLS